MDVSLKTYTHRRCKPLSDEGHMLFAVMHIDSTREKILSHVTFKALYSLDQIFRPVLNKQAQAEILSKLCYLKRRMRLWLYTMMGIDYRHIEKPSERRMAKWVNWFTPYTAVRTCLVMIWDSSVMPPPPGLEQFDHLRVLICENRKIKSKPYHYDRNFCLFRVPSLDGCSNLRKIVLSYVAFERIPDSWCKLRKLEKLILSFNPLLKEIPAYIGMNNTRFNYLNCHGCPRLQELPHAIIWRLNRALDARIFRDAYENIYPKILRQRLGADAFPAADGNIGPDASFISLFLFHISQLENPKIPFRFGEVLKVCMDSDAGLQLCDIYRQWTREYQFCKGLEKNESTVIVLDSEETDEELYGNIARLVHAGFVLYETKFDQNSDTDSVPVLTLDNGAGE